MFDPVLAADGFCYEASAISRWGLLCQLKASGMEDGEACNTALAGIAPCARASPRAPRCWAGVSFPRPPRDTTAMSAALHARCNSLTVVCVACTGGWRTTEPAR